MPVSPEQIAHYRQHGWLVVDGVYRREEADVIAELALRYSADVDASGVMVESGAAAPRKVANPFLKDGRFRHFALDQRLTGLLAQLLSEQPLLARDQIFFKPPRHGSAKPYHQDNAYFKCHPADHVITAWIALDDVDEHNGCLRYIDGSHREGILPHDAMTGEEHNLTPDPALIDRSRESLARVGKGGVVFHHGSTLHTSHRNESDRWRRAYATHWVTADVTSETDVVEKGHFRGVGV